MRALAVRGCGPSTSKRFELSVTYSPLRPISRVALATGCLLVSLQACAAAQGLWSTTELAPGVFAVTPSESYTLFANSLVVVGDSTVLVVDTRETEVAAAELVAVVRGITTKPVRDVVISHWHWDHTGGTRAFLDAFEDVRVWAHPETTALIRDRGAERLAEEVTRLRDREERLVRFRESGQTDSGRELEPEEYVQIEEILSADKERIAAFESTRLVVPSHEVSSLVQLDLGSGVTVHLLPAPAHTPGDVIVSVPAASVVYAGDLIEHGFPYLGEGRASDMPTALDVVAGSGATLHIPGHGPVPTDATLFTGQRRFWSLLVGQVDTSDGDDVTDAALASELAERFGEGDFPGSTDEEGPTEGFLGWIGQLIEQVRGERAGG